ncbi:MAG: hypothetical protein JZU55_06730, partial [Afipia sp.]|nr:hypothetical protein [Afipia sp.]
FDDGHARIVMKVRDDVIRHSNPTPILVLCVFAHTPARSDDAAAALQHTGGYSLFLDRGAGLVQFAAAVSM